LGRLGTKRTWRGGRQWAGSVGWLVFPGACLCVSGGCRHELAWEGEQRGAQRRRTTRPTPSWFSRGGPAWRSPPDLWYPTGGIWSLVGRWTRGRSATTLPPRGAPPRRAPNRRGHERRGRRARQFSSRTCAAFLLLLGRGPAGGGGISGGGGLVLPDPRVLGAGPGVCIPHLGGALIACRCPRRRYLGDDPAGLTSAGRCGVDFSLRGAPARQARNGSGAHHTPLRTSPHRWPAMGRGRSHHTFLHPSPFAGGGGGWGAESV